MDQQDGFTFTNYPIAHGNTFDQNNMHGNFHFACLRHCCPRVVNPLLQPDRLDQKTEPTDKGQHVFFHKKRLLVSREDSGKSNRNSRGLCQ